MRNQSKNRTRKAYRQLVNERNRLARRVVALEAEDFLFPEFARVPRRQFGMPEILCVLFITWAVIAVAVR